MQELIFIDLIWLLEERQNVDIHHEHIESIYRADSRRDRS